MIREKHTKSGKLFEADFYPIWNDGRRIPTRAPKTNRSTEAQAKYNHSQAVKKAIRIVNANFETGDIFMHITYRPENAPLTEKAAKRDFANYIRRVKTKRASELKRVSELLKENPNDKSLQKQKAKLKQPFLYYCPLEETIYKSGKHKGKSNWHFHLLMTGGIDRDTLEDMWDKNARVNADRFQPERFGPESAARYITKDLHGSRKILRSKNLKKPISPKLKDGRITARGVQMLATQRVDDKAYWERKYKGYRFIRCFARYNEYNGNWYVSVVMYKSDGEEMPQWEVNEWITEY